jgi:hypothetical protein
VARKRRRDAPEAPPRPLCLLLLPGPLERSSLREHAGDLLRAPGAVAVEPAALGYGVTGRMPALLRDRVAAGQARRMALPGQPRAIVVFDPRQYPLARALLARHPEAELWYGAEAAPARARELHEAAAARAALTFTLGAQNLPLWERMEALGIESGRLGSERTRP